MACSAIAVAAISTAVAGSFDDGFEIVHVKRPARHYSSIAAGSSTNCLNASRKRAPVARRRRGVAESSPSHRRSLDLAVAHHRALLAGATARIAACGGLITPVNCLMPNMPDGRPRSRRPPTRRLELLGGGRARPADLDLVRDDGEPFSSREDDGRDQPEIERDRDADIGVLVAQDRVSVQLALTSRHAQSAPAPTLDHESRWTESL